LSAQAEALHRFDPPWIKTGRVYRRICLLRLEGRKDDAKRVLDGEFPGAEAEALAACRGEPDAGPALRSFLAGEAERMAMAVALAEVLVPELSQRLAALISSASSDSVVALLQNIIITGGGSQSRGIDTVLQKRLADEGYESPRVRLAGQDFQRYVALGALKAARAARENQWQVLFD
jgi:hypothetical protein